MPFDGRGFYKEAPVKLDPRFTVREFYDWVKTKRGKSYFYYDSNRCAIATFLKERGHKQVSVGACQYHVDGRCYDIPKGLDFKVRHSLGSYRVLRWMLLA